MMVDRRHLEDPLSAGHLEIANLQNIRQYFRQINKSHDRDKQRHLQHISRSRHKTAKRQRTRIPHEYACRIYVKQQKSEQRSHHRTGNRLDPAACSNGHHRKKGCYDHCDRGSQTIQAVREIRPVCGTHYDKK